MSKAYYKPVNSNASPEAVALLSYLYEMAGKSVITGQHTQTRDMVEAEHVHKITDKYPKLCGFELLAYSPNINTSGEDADCISEINAARDTMKTAIRWAKDTGGIVSVCWHWFSPIGGKDKSFYSENTDFNPEKVLISDTDERRAFFSDMDVIADVLRGFCDEHIPILWRPFHEAEGDWFWWGRCGTAVAGELYKLMYKYFVNEKHLDNLLWVWNAPSAVGYPGDEYTDVISRDIYTDAHKRTDYRAEYEELRELLDSDKVAAIAECGVIPDVDILSESRVPWAYYMTWSREFVSTEDYNYDADVKRMYDSEYSVKL